MNNHLELLEAIRTSPIPVVVELGAAWCPPCRQLEPVLAELAERHAGAVAVYTLDVEQHRELADYYGVRSVPTVLAIRSGSVCAQQVGFSRRALEDLFAQLLG